MGKKSLFASKQGIEKAQTALITHKLKQKDIAARLDCSRQPVSRFFNGHTISSEIFVQICDILDLNWEDICENEQKTEDIDALINEVRQKAQTDIVERCGTMRVLDMRQPIGLNDIYTDVYILEKITASQRLELDQLNKDYNPDSDDFDRHWLSKREERVSGIDIVNKSPKVVILGKPGSGKTTFLKFLCLQCISGNFQSQRLPMFISLKEFAEASEKPDLLTFIQQKYEPLSITQEELIKVLTCGRGLIVLDGLDEVNEEDNERVIKELEKFSKTYSLSSLFHKDIKIHLEQREKMQTLIRRLEKKAAEPKAILRSLEKDYKIFENMQKEESEIRTTINSIETDLENDKKRKKIEQLKKLLNTLSKNIQKAYQIIESQKFQDEQQKFKPEFNQLKKKLDKLEKELKLTDILESIDKLEKNIEKSPKGTERIKELKEELKKLKEELKKFSKKQIQSAQETSNNQFSFRIFNCIQDLHIFLDNLCPEIENIIKHPNYIKLKQVYEKQKKSCDNLEQEIEQKKSELEKEYPDINDIEKYPTIASKIEVLSRLFPDKIYQTHFIITCRTASLDFNFTNFTEVEIADFNEQQIKTFVHKWFNPKDNSYPPDPIKEKRFLEQLSLNPAIQELANSPLLLTLLCLVFREDGTFPKNRSDLYETGLNILLKKWDIERNIYRDDIYRNLTHERKQDLLSQVALITFDRKDYFFKQREVEEHISRYIRNLPEAETDQEALRVDSEAVLKSIEAQHGLLIERASRIYSFSHLTFQEYFTARKIVNTSKPKDLEQSLRELASHIREKRWREVFLLAIGLLSQADFLIENMKEQVDLIAAEDRRIQDLLTWSYNRASYGHSSEQLTSIRIYYLTLASQFMKMTPINTISHFLENRITTLNTQSEVELIRQSFKLDTKLSQAYYSLRNRRFNPEFAKIIGQTDNQILKFHFNTQWLNLLKKPIPNPENQSQFDIWWKSDGKLWTEQLNNFFAQQPNNIPSFDLTSEQLDLLRQYFIFNEFLLECMNTNCMIDREVRQKIENTLFLPSSEMDDILIG